MLNFPQGASTQSEQRMQPPGFTGPRGPDDRHVVHGCNTLTLDDIEVKEGTPCVNLEGKFEEFNLQEGRTPCFKCMILRDFDKIAKIIYGKFMSNVPDHGLSFLVLPSEINATLRSGLHRDVCLIAWYAQS